MLYTKLCFSYTRRGIEMALSLNGKKSRFKLKDFLSFAETIGLKNKQVDNVFNRFSEGLSPALAFIDQCFLVTDNKAKFKALIRERAERLKLKIDY